MSTEEKSSHMFSGTAKNLILTFVFAVYLLAGAYIFQILEKEAESKVKVKTERHKVDFLKNYTCLTEDAVKQLINIQIVVEQAQFRLSVNNEALFQFRHRFQDLQQIKTVVIHGDLTLNGANVSMM